MAAALEKDAELDRRIAALRRKNEALVRRYQEIEEDRRRAEREGGAVTARPPRRGGDRDPPGPPGDQPKEKKPPGPPRISGRPPRGGGGGAGGSRPRGRGGGAGGGDGGDRKSQEWEQRRLQNIEQMNEEMEKIAEYERGRREGLPERNPVRNFLDDPRRCGPEPGGGPGGGPRRHQRNWGGPDFGKAAARRGAARAGVSPPLDPTLWMTGRQRAEYERWKRERERIDRERLQRHRDPRGAWRREWDAQKPDGMFSGVPEEPEGGGAPPGPPPPLPHPQRRRRGRGRGRGRPYSFHDDRWEPQPEPPPDPETPQVPGKVPEAPGSPGDSDQWEDLSDDDEDEDGQEGPSSDQSGPVTPSLDQSGPVTPSSDQSKPVTPSSDQFKPVTPAEPPAAPLPPPSPCRSPSETPERSGTPPHGVPTPTMDAWNNIWNDTWGDTWGDTWSDTWNDTWGDTWNDTWDDLYEDLDASEIPPGHRAVLVLYAAIFLLGVLGNGAVLWVTAAELRRTVNGVWFSNLALADLLSCLALPFLALPLTTDHHWPLGGAACKVLPSLTVLAMFASVLLLTAISADRCALVTRPVWCHNRRTPALAAAACAGAWAAAALLTVPSFLFRAVRVDPFSAKATCVLAYGAVRRHRRGAELTTAIVRFLCGFLGPFAVISGCYGRLLCRVRARGLARSQRATRTVLVVIVSFFVCWLPYHMVGLVLAAAAPDTAAFRRAQAADPAVAGLAYVNGCVNPIIYLVMGRGLGRARRSWRALLKGVLSDDPASAAGDSRARSAATTEDGLEGTAV